MTGTTDPRRLSPNKRGQYLKTALKSARQLGASSARETAILRPFTELLRFVVENNYWGGCHDTSAVLHMLLVEVGIESTLCIGEVGTRGIFFDHSWVEVDGLIYDAAVCMPHETGEVVGGPVFASVDTETGLATSLRYGASSGKGLDGPAQFALDSNLLEYSRSQDQFDIWLLAVALGARSGIEDPTFAGFSNRYGAVKRVYRSPATAPT